MNAELAPVDVPMAAVALRPLLNGRLRNISGGKPRHWFMAVAEATQNAMDAIEMSGHGGSIEIIVERSALLITDGTAVAPIINIVVRDTGIGFTPQNFDSFCTPDSLHKQSRGGKGLGRLVCLQAFHRVEGRSSYANGTGFEFREFVLQCEDPELSMRVTNRATGTNLTEIRLVGLRDYFASMAAISADVLADFITEHFLPALLEKRSWLESLKITDGEITYDLTARVSGGAVWSEKFTIGGYQFESTCYKSSRNDENDQVRLVAGGRTVDANTRPLEHYMPHLQRVAEVGNHVVLVRSSFFNEHVNDARNGISFSDDDEENSLLGITAPQFRMGLGTALRPRLVQRLSNSEAKLRARVEEIVRREAPFYRPLLEGYFVSKEFSQLSTSAREDDILASLDLYKRKDTSNLRRESRRIAKLQAESADYVESSRKLAANIEMQKKVALAEYVSLRRIVLDRLNQIIESRTDGTAHLEKTIHNLIFPQRTDSESNTDIPHQLWIIDERLESHAYLASDRPLDGSKGDRPDLLVALDRPGAFAAESSPKAKGYERIAMVEFKRALTDLSTVPTDDLPHRQMMRYAGQLIVGKAVHHESKRPIKTTSDVRFYMYAVCELSAAMLERLRRDEGFTLSPTGEGAFAVKNDGSYYLEYISLPKLLEDAIARNSAFFRKLGLEH